MGCLYAAEVNRPVPKTALKHNLLQVVMLSHLVCGARLVHTLIKVSYVYSVHAVGSQIPNICFQIAYLAYLNFALPVQVVGHSL